MRPTPKGHWRLAGESDADKRSPMWLSMAVLVGVANL